MAKPRTDGQPARQPVRMRLTDRFVKSVKKQPARTLYYDEVQKGFVLAVEPSGHKSFKFIYRLGRARWYHIADARAIGLKEARQIARDKSADVIKGVDVQSEKRAARRAGTFEELAERYVEERARKRNKSWEQADQLVRRYLLPRWGKLPARDVTRADVRAVHNVLAPVLANQVLAAASVIFSWGIKQEIAGLTVNPCHGVERNPTQARERVLSDSELPAFWQGFDRLDVVRASALRMILLTGQRPGEVCHMRREHLEIGEHRFTDSNGRGLTAHGAWWSLPGAPDRALGWPGCKNGQSHRVWLPKEAVAIVEEMSEGEAGFVFTGGRGHPIGHLDAAMREVCDQVGIARPDGVRPHDLRRTFSTMVASLGFSRDALNRVTNHKDGGIASVYDRHSYGNENRLIMEAVASRIMALVEGGRGAKVLPLKRR